MEAQKRKPSLGIVLLNWNGLRLLQEFLPSVLAHSKGHSIYLIDNGSTDSSVKYVSDCFPSVKIIYLKENFGFAKGYNLGLKQVEEDIYCLLNTDIRVSESWCESPLSLFQKEKNTVVIQPKIRSQKKPSYFEYAGAAGGFIDQLGYPYNKGRLFDQIEKDKGQYEEITEIFWASGACLFIRKKTFEEHQGFDEDFVAHMEEIDLCWRIKHSKKNIKYTPYSIVYHVGAATLAKDSYQKVYLNYRNNLYLLVKNLPKKQLVSRLITRMILDHISAIRMLFKLQPSLFMASIHAHFSFFLMIRKMSKKRPSNITPKYHQHKWIVVQYFLRRKKTYQELS